VLKIKDGKLARKRARGVEREKGGIDPGKDRRGPARGRRRETSRGTRNFNGLDKNEQPHNWRAMEGSQRRMKKVPLVRLMLA